MLSRVIDIEFERTKELAFQMNQMAVRLQHLSQEQFLTCIRNTKVSWNGETADRFVGKEVKLCAQIATYASELQQIANTIRDQAEAMYLAEQCNESIAGIRKYGKN